MLKSSQIPTRERLSSHPGGRNFTLKGGDMDNVLGALTSIAKEHSSLGDMEFCFEDDDTEHFKYPSCDNDLKSATVSCRLGLHPRLWWYAVVLKEVWSSEEESD